MCISEIDLKRVGRWMPQGTDVNAADVAAHPPVARPIRKSQGWLGKAYCVSDVGKRYCRLAPMSRALPVDAPHVTRQRLRGLPGGGPSCSRPRQVTKYNKCCACRSMKPRPVMDSASDSRKRTSATRELSRTALQYEMFMNRQLVSRSYPLFPVDARTVGCDSSEKQHGQRRLGASKC